MQSVKVNVNLSEDRDNKLMFCYVAADRAYQIVIRNLYLSDSMEGVSEIGEEVYFKVKENNNKGKI